MKYTKRHQKSECETTWNKTPRKYSFVGKRLKTDLKIDPRMWIDIGENHNGLPRVVFFFILSGNNFPMSSKSDPKEREIVSKGVPNSHTSAKVLPKGCEIQKWNYCSQLPAFGSPKTSLGARKAIAVILCVILYADKTMHCKNLVGEYQSRIQKLYENNIFCDGSSHPQAVGILSELRKRKCSFALFGSPGATFGCPGLAFGGPGTAF